MATLDREDIEAIATAVVIKLKATEQTTDDMKYLASLSPAERKQILKERRGKC